MDPILFDGKKLYVGCMVHVRGTYLGTCMPAVVLEFNENGVCHLAPVSGSKMQDIPYRNPNDDLFSWHYIEGV